jgi:hypothetical protein
MKMPNLRCSNFGLFAVVAMVASFSVVPAAALAQDPLSDPSAAEYNAPIPSAGGVAGTTEAGQSGPAAQSAAEQATPGGKGPSPSSNLGSLPFTGIDLIILAGVALLLTGTGFALRRLSMPREPRV